jgi:formylglycine-generating enzyme required for sulfatase activity
MAPMQKQERNTTMKIKTIAACALAALCLSTFAQQGERRRRPDGGERPRRHAMGGGERHRQGGGSQGGEYGDERSRRFSGDGERQRPQLNEETRQLIAAYRRDPTEANKAALRKQVEDNYDKMLEQRKARLEELKRSGRDQSRVKEMEERLDEMRKNREKRIDKMMSRFTDSQSRSEPRNDGAQCGPRGRRHGGGEGRNATPRNDFSRGDTEARMHTPRIRDSVVPGEFTRPALLPFGDGMVDAKIAQFPVTNEEYAQFVKETGHQPPRYWKDGSFPAGKGRHPVLWVSLRDAEAYCAWLGGKDPANAYRLPTEEEWEAAAGSLPRDAAINFNGVVAEHFLKKDGGRLVEFVHPKSELKGKRQKLSDVIAMAPNGGVRGWVNHRNYTGFIYTDLFKEISDAGGWTTPVDAYPAAKSACGALDMWGNCWEWTSTEIVARNGRERGEKVNAIKGGSWYANRNSCRTDYKGEGRRPDGCYNTVGFRIVAEPKTEAAE